MVPFFLMVNDHDDHLKSEQSLCPFKLVTGFPCPSCGITKSIVYFYEGDLGKSISYHILGPVVVFICLLVLLILPIELYTKKDYFKTYFYSKKLAYSLAIFLGIYHIIRLVYFINQHTLQDILKESIWK
jgi:hypothetical protein